MKDDTKTAPTERELLRRARGYVKLQLEHFRFYKDMTSYPERAIDAEYLLTHIDAHLAERPGEAVGWEVVFADKRFNTKRFDTEAAAYECARGYTTVEWQVRQLPATPTEPARGTVDAKDAQRYQWLREHVLPQLRALAIPKDGLSPPHTLTVDYFSWDNLAEAIDKAMLAARNG